MNDYIDKSILPYLHVNKVKDDLDLPLGQRAQVIFDCFRGQITEEFTAKLSANPFIYVTIPPNCTDLLLRNCFLKMNLRAGTQRRCVIR